MAWIKSPGANGFFISPQRKREDLAFVVDAFETFNGDEPVDLLKIGLKRGRYIEIFLIAFGLRLDFKDYCDHWEGSCALKGFSGVLIRWPVAPIEEALRLLVKLVAVFLKVHQMGPATYLQVPLGRCRV